MEISAAMDTPHAEIDLESEFVRFAREADVAALARVFDATAPGLLSVARHLTRGASEAEDLVQQTFVTAIERARTFDGSRSLLAWLTGILALHAKKHARQGARSPDPERLAAREVEDPHRAAQGAEIVSAVDKVVDALPEKYAAVLRLHLVDQLVPREIAHRIGVEPGTARVQLHRGLQMLREALPSGFGGFAAIPVACGAGSGRLAIVREAVLARGASVAQPIAAAAVVTTVAWFAQPIAWVAAALIAVVGGFALMGGRDADAVPEQLQLAVGEPMDPPALQADVLADPEPAPGVSATAAPRVEVPALPEAKPARARISGRLLLPSGVPAVEVRLALHGWAGNAQRMIDSPPPADWSDPEPAGTDSNGRFTFEVSPPRAFQFTLNAELEGHCRLSWRWTGIEAGARIDLGDRSFQTACTIDVRVLGNDGAPTSFPFLVMGQPGGRRGWDDDFRGSIEPIILHARHDAVRSTYVLEGVPPGPCEISVGSETGDEVAPRTVEARTEQTTAVDFVYTGVDPRTRIIVACSSDPIRSESPDLSRVHLHRAGEEVAASPWKSPRPSSVAFDGLAPGEYRVEVDDPRFEKFVRTGVAAGSVVRVKLRGNSALRIVLRASGADLEAEPQLLTITYANSKVSVDEYDLRQPEKLPVVDGYVTGLVAGYCELRLRVEGFAEKRVSLGELRPKERREVVVDLDRPSSLKGDVRSHDGESPSIGAVVLLTLGDHSGHGLEKGVVFGRQDRTIRAATDSTTTAADGRFEFEGLQKGKYVLRVAWSEWLFVDRPIEIAATPPQPVSIVEPPSGSIDIGVTLAEGATGHELGLMVFTPDVPAERPFLKDLSQIVPLGASHSTKLGPLAPGQYRITLMLRSGNTWTAAAETRTIDVTAGSAISTHYDLTKTLPGRLRVLQTVAGVARSSQQFQVRRVDGAPIGNHALSFPNAGEAAVGVLPPGRYRIEYADAARTWTWRYPREIEIESGKELVIEIEIPIVERTLNLLDAAGKPLASRGLSVIAQDDPAAAPIATRTDALGRVRVALLPARYRVRVDAFDSAPFEWNAEVAEPYEIRIAAR